MPSPLTVRAAVLRESPGRLSIEEVEVDRPGPREVRLRTSAAGLCHSDLHLLEGMYEVGTYPAILPTVLGHESSGVVEAVGAEVTYVRPGDHVVTCLSVYCAQCENCLIGRPVLCDGRPALQRDPSSRQRLTHRGEPMWQFLNLSSFAEAMLVHEHALVRIRPDMPLDTAALLGCGVLAGVGAALNTARVVPGTTVAVIGCGGVGLSCIQGAAIAGAGRIIAVDLVPSKLELAKALGATDVVPAGTADPVEAVRELTGGVGVHYAFEAIGLQRTVEQAFAMLRRGGTATVVGAVRPGQTVEIAANDLLGEKTLTGSNMGSNRFRVDIPRLIEHYFGGRLKLDELISSRLQLDEVNDGFQALRCGRVARSVVVFD